VSPAFTLARYAAYLAAELDKARERERGLRDLCGTAHALLDGLIYEGCFPPEGSPEDEEIGAIMASLDNEHMFDPTPPAVEADGEDERSE
jgi:hypothetical protein